MKGNCNSVYFSLNNLIWPSCKIWVIFDWCEPKLIFFSTLCVDTYIKFYRNQLSSFEYETCYTSISTHTSSCFDPGTFPVVVLVYRLRYSSQSLSFNLQAVLIFADGNTFVFAWFTSHWVDPLYGPQPVPRISSAALPVTISTNRVANTVTLHMKYKRLNLSRVKLHVINDDYFLTFCVFLLARARFVAI